MGARLAVDQSRLSPDWRGLSSEVRLNISRDRYGEYFHVLVDSDRVESVEVLDIRPTDRHLLLMVRSKPIVGTVSTSPSIKQRFLCGHDERAWFVAAIPESAPASSVPAAKEALKPPGVREAQERSRLKGRDRHKRKNRAFVRQGEWFFIPRPNMRVDRQHVLGHEPLRRGAGKPHWAEIAFRTGGETVYVSSVASNGLTVSEYRDWLDRNQKDRSKVRWTTMRRNAQVYVRGRIRHPDHKTIVLQDWHEVQMNTETQARAMSNVAFLD